MVIVIIRDWLRPPLLYLLQARDDDILNISTMDFSPLSWRFLSRCWGRCWWTAFLQWWVCTWSPATWRRSLTLQWWIARSRRQHWHWWLILGTVHVHKLRTQGCICVLQFSAVIPLFHPWLLTSNVVINGGASLGGNTRGRGRKVCDGAVVKIHIINDIA